MQARNCNLFRNECHQHSTGDITIPQLVLCGKKFSLFVEKSLDKEQKVVYITLVLWSRPAPRIVITMHQHGMSAKMARFLLKGTNIYNHRCYFSPVVQTNCVQVVLLQWCGLTSLNLQDFFVPGKQICKRPFANLGSCFCTNRASAGANSPFAISKTHFNVRRLLLFTAEKLTDNKQREGNMNIFVLDRNPKKAVQMLCDAHVRKMCVETAQILSGVRLLRGMGLTEDMPRPQNTKHPVIIAAAKAENWVAEYNWDLHNEYYTRFGVWHQYKHLVVAYYKQAACSGNDPDLLCKCCGDLDVTDMDIVTAYRKYYTEVKKLSLQDKNLWRFTGREDWAA